MRNLAIAGLVFGCLSIAFLLLGHKSENARNVGFLCFGLSFIFLILVGLAH
jgi:hypothetical protein